MNNQLINKEDLSVFCKIKNFFYNIFHKKTEKNIIIPKEIVIKEKITYNKWQADLKVNIEETYSKDKQIKELIQAIEDKPDLLEELSNDRLDLLIEYYEKVTNLNKIKIGNLKAKI